MPAQRARLSPPQARVTDPSSMVSMALSKASAEDWVASAIPSSRRMRSRNSAIRLSALRRTDTAHRVAAMARQTPPVAAAMIKSGAAAPMTKGAAITRGRVLARKTSES